MFASMDKLVGVQRALETGLLRCRDEVLQTFQSRLHHACNQAEEAAVQRSLTLITPQLAALEQRLDSHCQNMRDETNLIKSTLNDVSGHQERTSTELKEARADFEKVPITLDEFSVKLAAERSDRNELGREVVRQSEALRESVSEERRLRSEADDNVKRLFTDLSESFKSSLTAETERAKRSLAQQAERSSQQVSDLEKRFDAIIEVRSDEANVRLQDASKQFQNNIDEAMTQIEKSKSSSVATAQNMLLESVLELRSEIDVRVNATLAVAESVAKNLDVSCEQLRSRINLLEENSKLLVEERDVKFNDALRSAEERLAGVNSGLLLDMNDLRSATQRSDVLRGALRKTIQAESIKAKRDHQELMKTSAHTQDKLEARFTDEVADLSKKLSTLEAQLSNQSERLFMELRLSQSPTPTSQGVPDSIQVVANHCNELKGELVDQSKHIKSMGGDLDARCNNVRTETNKVKHHFEQQISALSTEVSSLRTAATSLTRGVVEALQIIGLFDVAPGSATRSTTDSGIGLQDLLAWEKAGSSLATRVARQWKSNELARNPTMLAALKHRLAVEEHAVAIELIRHAGDTSLSNAVKVQAPPTPSSGGAPASVANVRQQRVIPQTSDSAQ